MALQPTIQFASIGMADSLIIMVLALVVFGPRRLPQIGRQIGKLMYEFRKASNDFKYQMEEELRNAEDADRRKKEEERLRAMALAPPAEPVAEPVGTVETLQPFPAEEAVPGYPSPYPNEGLYPSVDTQAVPEPSAADAPLVSDEPVASAVEFAAEPDAPVIQPPSVGERVGANPPNRKLAETPAPADPSPHAVTVSPEGIEEPAGPEPANQEHVNQNG